MRLLIDEISFPNADDENHEAIGTKIELEGEGEELIRRQYYGESSMEESHAIDKLVTGKVREAMAKYKITVCGEDNQVFDACEGCFSVTAKGESGEGVGFVVVISEETN